MYTILIERQVRSFKKNWGNQIKTFGCSDKFSLSNHQNLRFAEHGLKQTLIFWNLIQYKKTKKNEFIFSLKKRW